MQLKEYLSTHRMTLGQFAEASGLHLSTVCDIANGKRWPSRKTAEAIRRVTEGAVSTFSAPEDPPKDIGAKRRGRKRKFATHANTLGHTQKDEAA